MLCARRKALRLVQARRSRRDKCATMPACSSAGASALRRSRPSCSRPRRGRCCAATERACRDERSRHGPGRLDRARAAGGRQPRARHRSGRVQGRALRPSGCGHRRRFGSHCDCRHGHSRRRRRRHRQARRSATGDERSPLFGAGNAGVFARDGRLFRRDDENRSESYVDILARAGLAELEGRGKSAADPVAHAAHAMHAHGAVFAEVKVDPDLGQVRVTRLVGAFAAGRIVNPRLVRSQYLWRHDLGRLVRAPRARHHRPAIRPRS